METYIIVLLCIASFFAGFVDAIVGGGGLIQTPVAMILMPNLSVASIIGSLKIPAFSGTSFAAFQYLKGRPGMKSVTRPKRILTNWAVRPITIAAASVS